ncbi:cytochrome c oxidase subunit 6B1-like isoform X2 [Ceratitis capitata]|uniref:cytochrome c oxidase subunit 6B1-like isoform X2 n=1 Tax=Ceratitis capitata TaxID=7213 RepID=UPI000329FFB0|nr:cytochrome c oxidase subunit 6B1-like isoform X2 [Ceratitis capitata]
MSKKDQKKSKEPEYKMETVPMDPRFPNMNVTRHCWFSYVEYHRCKKSREGDDEKLASCEYFQKVFKTMCPNAWVEKWNEQMQAGVFPGRI